MKEVVWIVGRGLLGACIESLLLKDSDTYSVFRGPAFSWNDTSTLRTQFAEAIQSFSEIVRKNNASYRIFWTAGKGILSSSEEDMKKETECFTLFLTLLDDKKDLKKQKGIIAFSSSAGGIYAGSSDDVITEDSVVAPISEYGKAKRAQEELLKTFAHDHLGVLIARITNLYGAGQSRTKRQGLLTHISRCLLTRTPIHIFVPFDTIRDYVHVHDASAECIRTSKRVEPGQIIMKILASEEPTTIASIIGLFQKITRLHPLLVTSIHNSSTMYPHRMRFCSKILKNSQSIPRMTLAEGIAETFEHERLAYITNGMPQ